MDIIKKLITLLTPRERKQVCLLFIAFLAMAFFDVAGIASVMPFIGVLNNPDLVQTNAVLRWAFRYFGCADTNSFLLLLGMAVLLLVIIANGTRLLALWFIACFVENCKADLSTRLLQCYLLQPYEFFLLRNTSDLSKNILEEINRVVHNILHHVLQISVRVIQAFCIFGLLVYMDPVLAVLVMGILGGSYVGIYFLIKRKLGVIGNKRILANQKRFQAVDEALGGIKDIKILVREKNFLMQFSEFARRLARMESYYNIVSQAPKFALETIAFGGILLIVLYFLATGTDSKQVMPVLALYAFAGYRFMPALQVAFVGASSIQFNLSSLAVVHEEMRGKSDPLPRSANDPAPLPLERTLELTDIAFSYQGGGKPVLQGLNLTVQANTTVGFAGTTGSGKTTLIDILLGLLAPQQGQMKVDGTVVQDALLHRWQRNIGYVPQTIYLADDSVARNIAFGVPDQDIDLKAVARAARIANLDDFVQQDLPHGYDTVIGERGVRLSGGQRQRIGIARALYHDPQVLILDEATSALDNMTEEQVMQAVQDLAQKKTIIMIAHRLTTLRECTRIYFLEEGRITASGSFAELVQASERFRKMARENENSDTPEPQQ